MHQPTCFTVELLESRTLLSAPADVAPAVSAPKPAWPNTPNLFETVLRRGSQRERVALLRNDGTTDPLGNRETWIIVHGWRGEPDGVIQRLADAVDGDSPDDQVLFLDWSDPADSFNPLDVVSWVPPVANWVARTLRNAGVSASRINLVGHSLGGYMIDAIAGRFSGGVNRIVALDPATDLIDLNIFGVNYADHSRYSQAFVGSFLSTPRAAFTADEAILMNVGDYNAGDSHIDMVDLYIGMLNQTTSGQQDRISRQFDLDFLSPKTRRPWQPDVYRGGYEVRLAGSESGDQWLPERMQYRSIATGRQVTVRP